MNPRIGKLTYTPRTPCAAVTRVAALGLLFAAAALAQFGGELRFCLHGDPKTFDPLLAEDSNSEAVRYLTGGVLLRVNRVTQEFTPELATSWKVDQQGRRITFHLRHDVAFSDGARSPPPMWPTP